MSKSVLAFLTVSVFLWLVASPGLHMSLAELPFLVLVQLRKEQEQSNTASWVKNIRHPAEATVLRCSQ